jgi:hypothetical protein
MSHAAIEWVLAHDRTTKGNYRALLIAIADCIRKDEGGWGWATRQRLMDRGGVTLDGYKKGIIALRKAGLIEVDRNGAANAHNDPDSRQAQMPLPKRANGYYFVPLLSDQRREEWEALRAHSDAERDALRAKNDAYRTAKETPEELFTGGAPSAPLEGAGGAPSAPPKGAPSAPPKGAPSAPPYIKDDPLDDPLDDPTTKSSVSNQDPAAARVDDDQQSEDDTNDLDGIHAAALDRLAQHDLEAVEAAEGPRHARIRWLTTARATRNDHDGPLIAAAIASGVTCPDELAARVLKHHDTPQRTASPSTPPQVAAQRRIAQANDERHAAMLAAPSSPLSPTTQASITDIRSKLR